MAPITRIEVRLLTSTSSGAGTIGPVYVGICRREFGVNATDVDFTPGHDFTYIFGDGANVIDAADNDPRTLLPLDTTDAGQFPWYIRQESADSWDLEEVAITVNPGQPSQLLFNALAGPNQHLVLGATTGKILYLWPPRNRPADRGCRDSSSPSSAAAAAPIARKHCERYFQDLPVDLPENSDIDRDVRYIGQGRNGKVIAARRARAAAAGASHATKAAGAQHAGALLLPPVAAAKVAHRRSSAARRDGSQPPSGSSTETGFTHDSQTTRRTQAPNGDSTSPPT